MRHLRKKQRSEQTWREKLRFSSSSEIASEVGRPEEVGPLVAEFTTLRRVLGGLVEYVRVRSPSVPTCYEVPAGIPGPGRESDPCGLFRQGKDGDAPVPLRSREVHAEVQCELAVADVVETFSYLSDVDVTVVTEVKKKSEAQEDYHTAVSGGHTAALMEKQAGASLFRVDLGNLNAMEECIITFSYVRLLDNMANSLEILHQATWVPPYLKESEQMAQEIPSSNPSFTDSVSYKLSYSVHLKSERGFVTVELPTHKADICKPSPTERIVNVSNKVSEPSKDFTILVELPPLVADKAAGHISIQTCKRADKEKVVALATFIPPTCPQTPGGDTNPCSQTLGGGAAASGSGDGHSGVLEGGGASRVKSEIWMLVDGSGSMGGEPIAQAKEAALFFIKDLPVNSGLTFNIVMFGSNFKMMSPSAQPCEESSVAAAVAWCNTHILSNMGGTEVHKALSAIYSMPLEEGVTRQIVFLTDGGVSSNEECNIYSLVEGKGGKGSKPSEDSEITIFSLGIGHGVHRGMVEAVAKKSGGVAQFVVDGEPIANKCAYLKRCALAAATGTDCLMNPKLEGKLALLRCAPQVLPPRLFPGEPVPVLIEILKWEAGASVELVATHRDGTLFRLSLPLDNCNSKAEGHLFAVLHAMACIDGLMSGTSHLHVDTQGKRLAAQPTTLQVTDAIVSLAVSEHVVTPYTSAVGVLLQQNPLDPTSVGSSTVPLQLPAGRTLWQKPKLMQVRLVQRYVMCADLSSDADRFVPLSAKAKKQASSGSFFAQLSSAIAAPFLGSRSKVEMRPTPKGHARAECASPPNARPQSYAANMCRGEGDGDIRLPSPMMCAPAAPAARKTVYKGAAATSPRDSLSASLSLGSSACLEDEEEEEIGGSSECEGNKCMLQEGESASGEANPGHEAKPAHDAKPGHEAKTPAMPLSQMLTTLNLERNGVGYWEGSHELYCALASQMPKVKSSACTESEEGVALRVAIPPELLDPGDSAGHEHEELRELMHNMWATILALVFLRKYLAGDRATWASMEEKAIKWLQANWGSIRPKPSCQGSLGFVMIAAKKLV
eukprot:gene16553-22782_t